MTPHEKYLRQKEYYRLHPESLARVKAYQREYLKNYKHNAKEAFRMLVRDHKKKTSKIPFDLSLEEFKELYEHNECFYCGGEIANRGYHIDRVIPSKGYTKSNIVPCCWPCNNFKREKPLNQFAQEIIAFAERMKKFL